MKCVYIAHPLGSGADREKNRERAARWVAWAALQGVAPVADWIILSGQWDESMRDLGLAIDVELVKRCDEVWLVGGRISPGMKIEAASAKRVIDLTHLGEEPPNHKIPYWDDNGVFHAEPLNP
jgi:hypothetical protein